MGATYNLKMGNQFSEPERDRVRWRQCGGYSVINKKWKRYIFLMIGVFLSIASVSGNAKADVVSVPHLTGHVVDTTGTLTSSEIVQLDSMLWEVERNSGTHLAVLMVSTTAPETIERFAYRVADKWKSARRSADDGAILVVAKNDRTLRIEVGDALQNQLSHSKAQQIVNEAIVPYLKNSHFYDAIHSGVSEMKDTVEGHHSFSFKQALSRNSNSNSYSKSNSGLLFGLLLVGSVLVSYLMRAKLGPFFGALATAMVVWLVALYFTDKVIALVAAGVAFLYTLLDAQGLIESEECSHDSWWGGHRHRYYDDRPRSRDYYFDDSNSNYSSDSSRSSSNNDNNDGGFGGGGASGKW